MARVFLGIDPQAPQRLLAVKTLLPKLARTRVYRDLFAAEGELAVRLRHRNIVRTRAHGVEAETAYIAMDYIFGFDLATVLRHLRRSGETMPHRLAATLARHVCSGLDFAHTLADEHGQPLDVVNRDVSPGNLMVGFDGKLKLIDFGIAQTTIDIKSQIGSIKGKISYMSPEQVRGLPVDHRSDLFSTGTVLYELLTGVHVFHDEGDFATMERVRLAQMPPPSEHDRRVDAELDAILMRAMAREVADRYQSAAEMGDALERWLASCGGPVSDRQVADFMSRLFGRQIDQMSADIEHARRAALDGHAVDRSKIEVTPPGRFIDEEALKDLEPASEPRPSVRGRAPASRRPLYLGLTAIFAVVGLLLWRAIG